MAQTLYCYACGSIIPGTDVATTTPRRCDHCERLQYAEPRRRSTSVTAPAEADEHESDESSEQHRKPPVVKYVLLLAGLFTMLGSAAGIAFFLIVDRISCTACLGIAIGLAMFLVGLFVQR